MPDLSVTVPDRELRSFRAGCVSTSTFTAAMVGIIGRSDPNVG